MLKPDTWIRTAIEQGIIQNAKPDLIQKGVMSYGVSSYGYDVRLADEVKIMRNCYDFANNREIIIDPKDSKENQWVTHKGLKDRVVIPPYSFALGYTEEYFIMPRDVTGVVFPKSTYARCGLNCLQTVIEAGWAGQITLEFANVTPNPVKLYVGEGCAQILFYDGIPCAQSYADRKGKYQGQRGITLAKVLK